LGHTEHKVDSISDHKLMAECKISVKLLWSSKIVTHVAYKISFSAVLRSELQTVFDTHYENVA